MFDFIHKNRRIVQIILALLTVPFAIWGIESYTRIGGSRDVVASVNGLDITLREYQERYRVQQDQVRRMFGNTVDPAQLDTPEARRALLESMVVQRLVAAEVARGHLLMSREAVIDLIATAPEFQENGVFSPAKYSAFLAQANTTDARNVADLQSQLPMSRLVGAVSESAIVPRAVAARLAALESQRREVSEARIAVQPFEARVKLDDAKLKAYYEANLPDFRTPERVRAEYVALSAESLARGEPVAEADVKAAYEARAAQYRIAEQRRVRHILVKTQAEADKLLAEVKSAPARFAELAKKHSDDTVSAPSGGDLGSVTRDSLVSAKLADAVMAMKQGEVRTIQSEFGFHVVQVTSLQAGKQRPLDEVRSELNAEILREKGAKRFAEGAETFTNKVYEQPRNPKPVAERFKRPSPTTRRSGKSGLPG